MNLITHSWNNTVITQLSVATKISECDVPAGYVNGTEMCKANGKQWKHYAENESSKEFWDALSRSVGIPTDLLMISVKTGSNSRRGTWVHPDIAIDLATWISADFKVWAMQTIRQVITGKIEQISTPPTQNTLQQSVETARSIKELYQMMFEGSGLDQTLILGATFNAIAKRCPEISEEIEDARKILPKAEIESELLIPRDLGKLLEEETGESWSAQRVNKLLIEKELQIKNPEGKNPDYLPTEKGREYSQLTMETAKGRDKTVQHLKWFESVLEVLEEENNS